jgi:hypothetical protein
MGLWMIWKWKVTCLHRIVAASSTGASPPQISHFICHDAVCSVMSVLRNAPQNRYNEINQGITAWSVLLQGQMMVGDKELTFPSVMTCRLHRLTLAASHKARYVMGCCADWTFHFGHLPHCSQNGLRGVSDFHALFRLIKKPYRGSFRALQRFQKDVGFARQTVCSKDKSFPMPKILILIEARHYL